MRGSFICVDGSDLRQAMGEWAIRQAQAERRALARRERRAQLSADKARANALRSSHLVSCSAVLLMAMMSEGGA